MDLTQGQTDRQTDGKADRNRDKQTDKDKGNRPIYKTQTDTDGEKWGEIYKTLALQHFSSSSIYHQPKSGQWTLNSIVLFQNLLFTIIGKLTVNKTRSPAVARVGRPCRLYPKASVRFSVKTISQNDCSPIHAMVTLLYRTLQLTL